MSDYKSMRLKKNHELEAAISSVPKDLYQWNGTGNSTINNSAAESKRSTASVSSRTTRGMANDGDASSISSASSSSFAISSLSSRPSFPPPPARIKPLQSTLKQKRPNSLRDLEKISATNRARQLNSAQPMIGVAANNQDFDLLIVEDLSDSSWSDFSGSNRPSKSMSNQKDRPYLNSGRRKSPGPASFRDVSDREAELVTKLNQKDALSVYEMDLSQLKLNTIKNLQKFPNLRMIDFSCNNIKKIDKLCFKNLIELKLFANEIEVIENLENLPELQSLQLQSNKIKSLEKSLVNLKKLEYLRIDRNKLTSISSADLAACHNLIYLDVSFNNLESLAFINCLPNLEELIATNLELKKLNDLDPNRCPKLSEIDLSHNQITDDQLSTLSNFENLTTLCLANNCLKSVKNLFNLKAIRCLDLSNNRIEMIADCVNFADLEILTVSNNLIKEWSQIEALKKCLELVDLNIKDNPVMSSEEKSLKDIFQILPNLKFINEVATKDLDFKKSSPGKKINKRSIDDTLFQFDYGKFEQESKIFDERIFRKLGEIKEVLDLMNNSEPDLEAIEKKSSRNRLQEALSFSKTC